MKLPKQNPAVERNKITRQAAVRIDASVQPASWSDLLKTIGSQSYQPLDCWDPRGCGGGVL